MGAPESEDPGPGALTVSCGWTATPSPSPSAARPDPLGTLSSKSLPRTGCSTPEEKSQAPPVRPSVQSAGMLQEVGQ